MINEQRQKKVLYIDHNMPYRVIVISEKYDISIVILIRKAIDNTRFLLNVCRAYI